MAPRSGERVARSFTRHGRSRLGLERTLKIGALAEIGAGGAIDASPSTAPKATRHHHTAMVSTTPNNDSPIASWHTRPACATDYPVEVRR